jgi:hypothetical protein
MKQAIHIFKKDLRHFRPMVIILLIFLALHVWLLWKDPVIGSAVSESDSMGTVLFNIMLSGILYLMLMVMMALLIYEDPPTGKPFWRTRPIFKKSMLVSKCAFVFLFGAVIPLAANFFILLHLGLEPQRIISCLVDSLSVHLSLLFALFAIAVLTPNLPYFFMAATIGLALSMLSSYRSAVVPFPSQVSVSCWLMIALSLSAIIHQYLIRRRALSAAIFVAGMLLIFGTDLDWYIAKNYRAIVSAHDPEIQNLKLAFQNKINSDDDTDHYFSLPVHTPGNRNLIFELDISNSPLSSSIELIRLKGMLIYEDGTKIPLNCAGTAFASEARESENLRPKFIHVTESVFGKYGAMSGTFTGEAVFKLVHYTTVGRLPLKQGSFFRRGSQYLSLDHKDSVDAETVPLILKGRSLVSSQEKIWAPITTLEKSLNPELSLLRHFEFKRSLIIIGGPMLEYSEKNFMQFAHKYEQAPVDTEHPSPLEILIRNKTETGPFVRKMEVKNVRMSDYTEEAWMGRINESIEQGAQWQILGRNR